MVQDPTCPHNVARTLVNIAAGSYRPIPADVSRPCADLIRSLLVVDPRARPSLEAVLAHPWLATASARPAKSAADGTLARKMSTAAGAAVAPEAGTIAAAATMDVDTPAAVHSSAEQDGMRQAAAAASVLAQLDPPAEEAAGTGLGSLGSAAAAIGSHRAPSASDSAELPASISAFPVQPKRSFSFHMGGAQEGGKAAPATPRVVSLAATAGSASAAGTAAGANAPAQQGPPSRGGGPPEEAQRPRFGLAAFLCGFLWG